jgi:hypothetical protein
VPQSEEEGTEAEATSEHPEAPIPF